MNSDLRRGAQAPDVLAEAALAYGSVFQFATVDSRLVLLLEQADINLASMSIDRRKLFRVRILSFLLVKGIILRLVPGLVACW